MKEGRKEKEGRRRKEGEGTSAYVAFNVVER